MGYLAIPSLRWRLVSVMCLAYIVVSLTTLIATYTTEQTNLHGQLESRARTDATILAAGASGPMSGGPSQSETLQTFVASLRGAQALKSALVVRGDGLVVAATYTSQLGTRVKLPLETGVTATAGKDGEEVGMAPIVPAGTYLGWAEVVLTDKSVTRDLQTSILKESLVRGLGLVIFLLLSLVIAQYILGPLARLARAASAIRHGAMSTRVPGGDGTELSTVAEAFNAMAASLEQRIKHLSFLARSGSELPNTLRGRRDVDPILEEFCRNLDTCGVCLLTSDLEEPRDICYSIGRDEEWLEVAKVMARRTNDLTSRYAAGFTVMAVPVLQDEVFTTARKGDRPFTDEEQQVITNFAYQIGIAADNVRLLESQQEALQLKDQFLSIVSHEFRTPLTTIKGYSQILQQRVENDATSHRFAANIDAQVTRLGRLVDDLLDVTRFSRGQFELMPEQLDIRPVLEDVVARFRLVSPNHTLRLVLDHGSFEGFWDHDRLEQVMNNLVGNAVKYSPDGGEVTVLTRHEGDNLVVSVRDQGVGISEEDQQRLFQRFYRGLAEGHDIKGLGLGLYVTRRIVEAHGGVITVRSKPGEGSEFTFTLPIQQQAVITRTH